MISASKMFQREKWLRAGVAIAIIVLCAVVLLPKGHSEFLLLDDETNLTKNPMLQSVSWLSFLRIWRAPYAGLYIPVTYTIWGLLAALGQFFAGTEWKNFELPFLGLNLLTHLCNGFLFYELLKKLFGGVKERWALVCAVLIFLLHPIQVESVVWASGFKELIWTTFALLAIHVYLEGKWAFTFFFFVLAVLSKPTAAILPLVFLLLDFTIGRKREWSWKKIVLFAAMTLAGIGDAILTHRSQPSGMLTQIPSLSFRVAIAADALGFYFQKLVWPAGLAPDYGRNVHWLAERWPTLDSIIPLLALFALGVCYVKRVSKKLFLGAGLLLIPLFPVLGFVPFIFQNFSTVADRYLYFPMMGFSLLLLQTAQLRERILLPVLGCIVLSFAALSFVQAEHWRTNERLLTYILKVNPASFLAEGDLGMRAADQGHKEEALARFQRAFDLNPDYSLSARNLASTLVEYGMKDRAAAFLESFISKHPADFDSRMIYGTLLLNLSRPQEALDQFEVALKINSFNADLHGNCAVALWKLGRRPEAIRHMKIADQIDPGNRVNRSNWELMKKALGESKR